MPHAPLALILTAALLAGSAAAARTPPPQPAPPAGRVVLPGDVVPLHYDLEITPDVQALTFQGRVGVDLEVRTATRTVVLNAAELAIRRADGAGLGEATVALDPERQTATLTFPVPLPPGRRRLTIDYSGPINRSSSGFFAVDYQAGGQPKRLIATKFEPAAARRFLPLWDEPGIKATYSLTATVPAGWTPLSNMPVAAATPLPGGLQRVSFRTTPRMSSYLLFFGAGELGRISAPAGRTLVSVVARREAVGQGRFALDVGRQVVPFYNAYFGTAYPLPKLDLIGAPGAGSFGAMENWGAIFFFDNRLLVDPATAGETERRDVFSTVAHEIAHQWFGDLVTMAWWDDLWLNEGFASWMEGKAMQRFHPEWNAALNGLIARETAMRLDAQGATHPVVQPVADAIQANSAFDDITYDKGQAVIAMMEAFVGERDFRAGVRRYMKVHAYGGTVTADLWREVEAASGKPVTAIARGFTDQPGLPLLRVSRAADGTVALTPGRLRMGAQPEGPESAWAIPVTVRPLGAAEVKVLASGPTRVPAAPDAPVLVNAGQTAYVRVAYDPASFAALASRYGELSPVDQYGLLSDAWALGQSGDMPIQSAPELVSRLPPEADPQVWQRAVTTLSAIDRLYDGLPGQAAWRAHARRVLEPVAARIGWDSRPGEDANLGPLRETVLTTLSRLDDPATVAEARRRFAAFRADPGTLQAALRAPVLAIVGRHADEAGYEALRSIARAAEDPTRKRQYLTALAGATDPALAARTLAMSLTPEVPPSAQVAVITAVAATRPDLAWRFIQDNEAAIAPNLDLRGRYQLAPRVAAPSNARARAEDLATYARTKFPAGARRFADQTQADIAFRAEVRDQRLPDLDRWVAASGPPP